MEIISAFPSCAIFEQSPVSSGDFKFGRLLGKGIYATVHIAKHVARNTEYAVKVMEKCIQHRGNRYDAMVMEATVLYSINHVFIAQLHHTFQDVDRVYFVLEYVRGGDMLTYLNLHNAFSLECAQFYAAEIYTAIEYLHCKGIAHRDIKPQNILLTERMHIKLADFGSAMFYGDYGVTPPRITASPEYVSPEMVSPGLEKMVGNFKTVIPVKKFMMAVKIFMMDYWALGCVIYHFLVGRPPFLAKHHYFQYEIYEKTRNLDYKFPGGFDLAARHLVKRLLILTPGARIGSPVCGGVKAIKQHPFFSSINWDTLSEQTPPLPAPSVIPPLTTDWDELPVDYGNCINYLISEEGTQRLRVRALEAQMKNPYHQFVQGNLILKQGFLMKRRFFRKINYMFLLTDGPHLYYVDTKRMQLKGEVPWSPFMFIDLLRATRFIINLPEKTLYFYAQAGDAEDWVDQICTVANNYFSDKNLIPKLDGPRKLFRLFRRR